MSLLGGGGKSKFDRLLEAATSQMLLEPSWIANLELCDNIRQNDVSPKYAMAAIRKKIKDPNPHVCKYALIVLETCVKNCGQPFQEELPSHDFMDDLRTLAQVGSAPVKAQVLLMVQAWNHVFRNKSHFQPILATFNLMKMEGYQFPPISESDAMFSADAAPVWKEGDVCHMCRVKFATFTRQHHCRACGEVFCSKCSAKQSIIPKIGIEREVRVCDPCFDEINPDADKPDEDAPKQEIEGDLPLEYLNSDLAKEAQTKPKLSEAEIKAQEEEEMQLALVLSISEEEANKKTTSKNWSPPAPASSLYEMPVIKPAEPKKIETQSPYSAYSNKVEDVVSNENSNSELTKYLDRSYWERKNAELSNEPSAPVQYEPAVEDRAQAAAAYTEDIEEEETVNSDAFVQTFEKSIEMFLERMQNVQMKGKHIAMDTTVQSLFQSLSAMHPQMIKLIEDEEDSKAKYEAMLKKLAVIREARESLNDMRAQHQEKVRQQELEQEMLRRMQMEQKLELMRQQKQEYLEYQRLLQIQRQQELEVYQQEKFRQRQAPGITAGYPDYQGQVPAYPNYPSIQQNYPPDQQQSEYPPVPYSAVMDAPPPSYATVTSQVKVEEPYPPQPTSGQWPSNAVSNMQQLPPTSAQQDQYNAQELQRNPQQYLTGAHSQHLPKQVAVQQQDVSYQFQQQQQIPPQQVPMQQGGQLPPQQQVGQMPPQQQVGQMPPQQQGSQMPPQQQGRQMSHQIQGQMPPQLQERIPPPYQSQMSSQQQGLHPSQQKVAMPPHQQAPAPQLQGQIPPQQQAQMMVQQQGPMAPQQQAQMAPQQQAQLPAQHPSQLPPQHVQLPPQQQGRMAPQQNQGLQQPDQMLPENTQQQQLQYQQHQTQMMQQPALKQQPAPQDLQQQYHQPPAGMQQQQPQIPSGYQTPQPGQSHMVPNQQVLQYGQQGYQVPTQQYGNQQLPYGVQLPHQNSMQELSGNMKDLQLISFD